MGQHANQIQILLCIIVIGTVAAGVILFQVGKQCRKETRNRAFFPGSVVGGILCWVVCLYALFMVAVWPHIMWRPEVVGYLSSASRAWTYFFAFAPGIALLLAGLLLVRRGRRLPQKEKFLRLRRGCVVTGVLCFALCVGWIILVVIDIMRYLYPM